MLKNWILKNRIRNFKSCWIKFQNFVILKNQFGIVIDGTPVETLIEGAIVEKITDHSISIYSNFLLINDKSKARNKEQPSN